MSAGLILDAILVFVVALYVPIGAWRGGMREAALGGALVMAAATSFAWAPNWGDRLADIAEVSPSTGRFWAAIVAFASIGLGLGYSAGIVARHGVPDPLGRVAGGVFGLLNVLFALATTLAFVVVFLPTGRPSRTVAESHLADLLADSGDWLLLLAVPVYAIVAIAFRWSLRLDDDVAEQPALVRGADPTVMRRSRSVSLPHDPDSGKIEPPPGGVVAGDRGRQVMGGLAETTRELVRPALVPADLAHPAAPGNGPAQTGRERNGPTVTDQPFPAVSTVIDDWLRRAAENNPPRADDEVAKTTRPRSDSGDPGGDAPATSFTGASFSSLLDPGTDRARRRERRANQTAERSPAQPTPGDGVSDQPQGEQVTGAGPLAPIRRCRVCGTPAVSGLDRCPFCGAEL